MQPKKIFDRKKLKLFIQKKKKSLGHIDIKIPPFFLFELMLSKINTV